MTDIVVADVVVLALAQSPMKRRIFGNASTDDTSKICKKLGFGGQAEEPPPNLQSGGSSGSTHDGLGLTERLLKQWASGDLSSKQIQDFCAGVVVSGCTDPAVKAFSKLGAHGLQPSHMQRDLMHTLGAPLGTPRLTYVSIPVLDKSGKRIMANMLLMLPHFQFAKLYEERRSFFTKSILGMNGDLEGCWQLLAKQAFLANHPALKQGKTQVSKHCVPLGMHGDAGSIARKQSVCVLSWNSLVGQGRTKQTKFVMAVLKKTELCLDGSTLDESWKVLRESLHSRVRTSRDNAPCTEILDLF